MKRVILALFALHLAEAQAQTTYTLETIEVKGTKEGKTYFENPESVVILKENELPATGRENDLQILNAVPNVEINRNGESFSIRGINSTGVTGFQKDNLASLVIDDLFQTDLAIQAGSFYLWDMERVEILRGAQSTSQGVNSLAGTILLDHARPKFANEGAAKLGLGNFGHKEFAATVNRILRENKLATRISYDKELNNGYIKNVTTGNDKWGRWNRDRLNLGLSYRISEVDLLDFKAKYNQNAQGGTYVQGNDPFKYEVYEDEDYNKNTRTTQFSARYSRKFHENLDNLLFLGYSRSFQENTYDADFTSQPAAGKGFEDHDDHFMTVENRLHYRGEKFSNLFGVHAHDFKLRDDYRFNLLFPLDGGATTPVAVRQESDRIRRVFALFDSLTYRMDENHSVNLGVRGEYTDWSSDVNISGQRLQDLGPGVNPIVDNYIAKVSGPYHGSNTNIVVLPKFSYTYSLEGHHIGFVYARGYRTAGVSVNRWRATTVNYGPEFTNNYEVSYKFAGQDFQFGANVFYIDWRDQQVQVQLSNDFYDNEVRNAASSEVYGAEVEGKFNLTARQTFTAGFGYADTRFNDFEVHGANYSGNKFPYAANWTSRVSHEYRLSDDLSLFTVLRYVSEAYSNVQNTRKSDDQFYVNLNARYAYQNWMIEGYVNNLFDSKFRIYDGTPLGATSPYQTSLHQVNTPREFGARVVYYF